MFCYNCGNLLQEDTKFCTECGQKLDEGYISEYKKFVSDKKSKQQPLYELSEIQAKMNEEGFKNIIMTHAFGAASAGLASGWIPGAGSAVAVAAGMGFIVSMYARMSNYLGIEFSKNKLKVLGTSTISVLSLAALNIAAGTALSFIPGVGSVAASALAASVAYANINVSAMIFKTMIVSLVATGKNVSDLSEEELQDAIKNSMSKDEIKKIFKEAQSEFKVKKDSGEFDQAEKASILEEFDETNN